MNETRVVRRVADDVWARICRRDPETVMRLGGRVDHLPWGGPAAMTDGVAAAQHDLRRLAGAIPQAGDRLLAAFLHDHLTQEIREAERFWYRFPVTPFNMLHLSTYREQVFGAMTLAGPAEVEHYLGLLDDYVALVAQLRVTLEVQRRRGNTPVMPTATPVSSTCTPGSTWPRTACTRSEPRKSLA